MLGWPARLPASGKAPSSPTKARQQDPTSVRFTIDRQANVDQLLAVAGNSAEYSVALIDVSRRRTGSTVIDKGTHCAGADSRASRPRLR